MTIAMAWIGTHGDGREHLWMASDSRTRGAFVLDSSPKLMPLSRSDSAICFAGDTAASYPLMMQLSTAIAAHQPARERSLDLGQLKDHLLRVCSDIVRRIADAADPFQSDDAQFLLGGYSWRKRSFQLWTFRYESKAQKFSARPARNFHQRLGTAAFIGDWATRARHNVVKAISDPKQPDFDRLVYLQPFSVLASMLREAGPDDSIGGAPQLLRVAAHMNTRPLCVKWGNGVTLFGRTLFEYENSDYWIMNPDNLKIERPRKYGNREVAAPEAQN